MKLLPHRHHQHLGRLYMFLLGHAPRMVYMKLLLKLYHLDGLGTHTQRLRYRKMGMVS
ncbi:MAG: hypothetical protein PHE96_12665 [Methylococcales bacterium]|nr:hypothetical protein [Methylococcales bacterium]